MEKEGERNSKKPDFVKWFSELSKDSVKIAGGKGANLAEIYNMKIPVPPGFVVTADAYDYFIEKAGIKDKIQELLGTIEYNDTARLEEVTKKIRDMIVSYEVPDEMKEEILESYENLDIDGDQINKNAHELLRTSKEDIFVAVRSSATAEDLEDASFAGQQDTYLNVKGNRDLMNSIKKCFASLFTARATYYRQKKGFKHEETKLAVVVQKMIDSDKSGVIFSKDPSYNNDNIIIEAVYGLGEGIVSGRITPDRYVISKDYEIEEKKIANKKTAITRTAAGDKTEIKLNEDRAKAQVLKEDELRKLSEFALKLEDHYGKPQDIEFAIESGEIYIVQTRAITTIKTRGDKKSDDIKGEVVIEGLAASPGIAAGKVKIIKAMSDLSKISEGDVLVTKMTNPDMVVAMQRSTAIITDEGGMTAHAAIVSREMGIPCIVGTDEATVKLKDDEMVTVDGNNGKVFKGKVAETKQKEIHPVTANTKTKIKVIVDLPTYAERASKTGIKSVGLTRIEGIIAESGKHPNYYVKNKNYGDYEDVVYKGIEKIAEYFDEIWVRSSDIRSDEFSNLEGAPKEKEANPMLGMHGIRYSLTHPDLFMAELEALKKVAEKGKKIGILMPQIISPDEVRKAKEYIKDVGFDKIKVGVMVETPASVQMIKEICEEGIDFISFGTNDLTQYILAVDRGNESVQDIYNEMHPAILKQMEFVIRVCKRNNVETSICGQAGSRKDMAKFLVEKQIDSISVNADMAKEISDYVAELEGVPVKKQEDEKEEGENAEEETKQKFESDPSKEKPYFDIADDEREKSTVPETKEDLEMREEAEEEFNEKLEGETGEGKAESKNENTEDKDNKDEKEMNGKSDSYEQDKEKENSDENNASNEIESEEIRDEEEIESSEEKDNVEFKIPENPEPLNEFQEGKVTEEEEEQRENRDRDSGLDIF